MPVWLLANVYASSAYKRHANAYLSVRRNLIWLRNTPAIRIAHIFRTATSFGGIHFSLRYSHTYTHTHPWITPCHNMLRQKIHMSVSIAVTKINSHFTLTMKIQIFRFWMKFLISVPQNQRTNDFFFWIFIVFHLVRISILFDAIKSQYQLCMHVVSPRSQI